MPKFPLKPSLIALLLLAPQIVVAQETPEDIRNRAVELFAGTVDDRIAAIEAFEQAAMAGDPASMSLLADIYLRGDGVDADRSIAVQWYYQAALAEQPGALEKLAELAQEAVPTSALLAETALASAAAKREGGLVYWRDADPSNDTDAVANFRMAAEEGDVLAASYLGDAYFSGYGVTADLPTALYWYERGAATGDSTSMTTLARIYRDAISVDRDLDLAFAYAADAAAAGAPLGLRYLGDMYRLGEGTPKDFANARDNLEAAASLGDIESQPLLGELYAKGIGGRGVDLTASFNAYKAAYDAGIVTVALPLAEDYRKGAGTKRNAAAAVKILKATTTQPDGYLAMVALGDVYLKGELGKVDTKQAADWYRQASDLGFGPAQASLGDLYRRGAGVERDLAYAKLLYETALSNGEKVKAVIESWPDAAAIKGETAFSRAKLLASGPLSAEDEKQLRGLYLTAADKDDVPEAMALLADMLSDGRGGKVSDKEAFGWRLRAANAGVVEAMIGAGKDYEAGRGVNASRDKALAFYQKASGQGSDAGTAEFERLTDTPVLMQVSAEDAAKAMDLFDSAKPLIASADEKERAKGLKLYAEAASLGNVDAMLAYGERVAFDTAARDKDRKRAFGWLEYAARTGRVPAMGLIARGYAEGKIADRDLRAATRWYARAADGGDVTSLVAAADFYLNGAAAPADAAKGGKWLEQALSLKQPNAAFVAARAHLPKGGLSDDAKAAAEFMVAALREGDSDATAALTRDKWPTYAEPFRKALQEKFVALGLYDGAVDGLYGSRTAAAIEEAATP